MWGWCRWDNSTVPSPPIQRSYGTHSHTTFPTLNSISFWPVKAVGQLAPTTWAVPPNKSFFISNYEITAHENSANSYDSNGTKYMRIRDLYEEIQNLLGFCLHEWRNTWSADLGVTRRMLYRWKGILTTSSAPFESRKSDQWKWRKGRIMQGMVNAGGKTEKRGLCT